MPAPMTMGTGDPADCRCVSGTASTMRDVVRPPTVTGCVVVGGVVGVGIGAVVEGTVRGGDVLAPFVVGGDDGRTGGDPPAPVDCFGEVVVGVLEVLTAGVVVVGIETTVFVARTAPGENDGWPLVPLMSVDPNVQASTLPGCG
jgi:hypothetical protein